MKTVEYVSSTPQERALAKAVKQIDVEPSVREFLLRVNHENTYSYHFLMEPENHKLAEAIMVLCKQGNALPPEQCDTASEVLFKIELKNQQEEARKRVEALRKVLKNMEFPDPHKIKMFKD